MSNGANSPQYARIEKEKNMDKSLKKKQILESEDLEKTEQRLETTDFESWFGSKVQAGSLSLWQYNEVLVFFQKNGLSKQEELSAFEKCFKRFK